MKMCIWVICFPGLNDLMVHRKCLLDFMAEIKESLEGKIYVLHLREGHGRHSRSSLYS